MKDCLPCFRGRRNTGESSQQETEHPSRPRTENTQRRSGSIRGENNLIAGLPRNAPEQQTVGQQSNSTEVAGRENEPNTQVDAANTPQQKLELVRTEVKKMEFKYGTKDGDDGDCGLLAAKTVKIAQNYGFNASQESENHAMLVEKGTIKGDTRQSNTEGEEMWFFNTHYWCKIEGIEYDPLFDKQGSPNMDLLDETKEHCECRIFKFKSGKAMVLENPNSEQPITADTVFQSYEKATEFVEKKNPNYTSDSE